MRRELAKCLTLAGWRSYTSARFDRRTLEHLAALRSGLSSCQNDSTDNRDQDKYAQKHKYSGFMIDL